MKNVIACILCLFAGHFVTAWSDGYWVGVPLAIISAYLISRPTKHAPDRMESGEKI